MKTIIRKIGRPWAMGVLLLVVCTACASAPGGKKEPAPEPAKPAAQAQPQPTQAPAEKVTLPPQKEVAPPPETFFVHTIKWSGESLSIIAAWYTGDLQNWKILAEANPEINPNRVHEGMRIRIPERIMTTKAPMTREHVDSYYPKAKKPTRRGAEVQEKDEEPKLFGPKEFPGK